MACPARRSRLCHLPPPTPLKQVQPVCRGPVPHCPAPTPHWPSHSSPALRFPLFQPRSTLWGSSFRHLMRTWEPLPQVSQPSLSLLSICFTCFFLAREIDPKIPDPSSLGLWPQFIDLSLCCLSVLLGTRPKSPSYPPFLPRVQRLPVPFSWPRRVGIGVGLANV